MKHLAWILSAALMTAVPIAAQELSAADLDRRRVALRDLLDEQWEYTLRTSPEFASMLGDRRYNDQVSDVSEAAVRANLAASRSFLRRFEAIEWRKIIARYTEQCDNVALVLEAVSDDLPRVLDQADHSDGRCRQNAAAVGLVVKGDVARDDGRFENSARLGHAVDHV